MSGILLGEIVREYYDSYGVVFHDNLLAVKMDKKWGFINEKGEQVIPCEYESVYNFHKGLTLAKVNESWGIINTKGETVTMFKYDSIDILPNKDGASRFIASKDHQYKVIDSNDKAISSCYDNISFFNSNGNLVEVLLKQKYGYIDIITGKEAIPPIYDHIYICKNAYIVEMDDKYGIITKNNETIVPCEYDHLSEFSCNSPIFEASLEKKTFLIYIENEKLINNIIELKYDGIREINHYNKLIIVKKEDKFGAIDYNGQEVISCVYDNIYINDNDTISLVLYDNETIVIVGNNGKELIKFDKLVDKIGSRDDTLYYAKCKDTYWLGTGCFLGTLNEFEKALEEEHAEDTLFYKEYMEVINILKAELK